MKLSGRSFIITLLVIAVLLIALIGYLIYGIIRSNSAEEVPTATLFIIDSSQRMSDPMQSGNLSKLEAAKQVVQDSVNRLPQSEVVSVHVFGSGAKSPSCADTLGLVPAGIENSNQVITRVNGLNAGTEEAAMVQAAVEAVEELGDTGFEGIANLVFVIGGAPTCDLNQDLIARAANRYRIEIKTAVISLQSERDAGEGFTFDLPFGGQEIEIGDAEEIAELVPTLFPGDSLPNLDPDTPTPTETPIAPILEPATPTPDPIDSSPGGGGETEPTEDANPGDSEPTAVPTETPVPSDTPIPSPTNTSSPPVLGTNTPTIDPNAPPTDTPTPDEEATSTPSPTNTPLPPTNTFTPPPPTETPRPGQPTSPPPTAEPDSVINVSDIFVDESRGSAFVILSRSGRNSKQVRVDYQTVNGSATAGSDYVPTSGQVVWEPLVDGEQTVIIGIVDDQVLESNETFSLNLSNVVNATLSQNSVNITIQDNESGDVIINPSAITVSESAGSTSAAITLNGPPQAPVTVSFSSTNGNVCIPPNQVTLDQSNWNASVPIGITIVDNPDINLAGVDQCTIQTSATSSSDPNFNGINPADINIEILDNDATYVNGACSDVNGNGICDDGIRFRTIQAAIDNGLALTSPTLNIIVTNSPHTEANISVDRDIVLSGPAGTIIQAAGSPGSASGRIMTVENGANVTLNSLTLQNGNIGSNGGAILNNGNLTVQDVTFINNRATGSGGAIALTSTGVLNDTAGGIYDTNISGNCGGAIYVPLGANATVGQTNFSRNEATNGGAICADGAITINGGVISGNVASSNGGAAYINTGTEPSINAATVSSNRAANGGAVYINDGATFRTTGSTYSTNQADGGAGGGILARGDLTTWNVTISSNQSGTGGAGIDHQAGIVNLYNSTIAFNTSLSGGPSGLSSTTATLFNTILDANVNGNCNGSINLFYALVGIQVGTCTLNEMSGTTNQIGVSAGLGGLSDNGGDTNTHAPAIDGPAIDTGWPFGQGCEGNDQAGNSRTQGAACDIGSLERR